LLKFVGFGVGAFSIRFEQAADFRQRLRKPGRVTVRHLNKLALPLQWAICCVGKTGLLKVWLGLTSSAEDLPGFKNLAGQCIVMRRLF
jgi:hypothetical protein